MNGFTPKSAEGGRFAAVNDHSFRYQEHNLASNTGFFTETSLPAGFKMCNYIYMLSGILSNHTVRYKLSVMFGGLQFNNVTGTQLPHFQTYCSRVRGNGRMPLVYRGMISPQGDVRLLYALYLVANGPLLS